MHRDTDHDSDGSQPHPDGVDLFLQRFPDTFSACREVFTQLTSDRSDAVSAERQSRIRLSLSRLAITVIGLWEAIYTAAGIDLHAPATAQGVGLTLYSDGMLAYTLLDTIWAWNVLDEPTSSRPDRNDVELSRALVRFLDLAIGTDYYSDVRKRSEEAIGDMLVAFPSLLQVMDDEAQTRSFAPDLRTAIKGMSRIATMTREERRR